jgi:hypothetical protein
MSYVAVAVGTLAVLFGVFRLSLWLTDRKMSAQLAKTRPDGSASNGEGWPLYDPTGTDGGAD